MSFRTNIVAAFAAAVIALACAAPGRSEYTDTHPGSAIEVRQGSLHIDLQDSKGKMYVSVKGGVEVEVFDMAERLAALEAKFTSLEQTQGTLVAGQKANTEDIAGMSSFSTQLQELARAQGDDATKLKTEMLRIEEMLSTEMVGVEDDADKLATRATALESASSKAGVQLALLPKMLDCSRKAQLYHPEDDSCQPPASVHCDALTGTKEIAALALGAKLKNPAACAFNKHYGGQTCAATCVDGARAYFDNGNGKKYIDEQSSVASTIKCGQDGKWAVSFKCEWLTCNSQPSIPDASTQALTLTSKGATDQPNTLGASMTLSCKDKDATMLTAGTLISKCAYDASSNGMAWTPYEKSTTCDKQVKVTYIKDHIGCHINRKNVGFIGRDIDFLGGIACRTPAAVCVNRGKVACVAIRKQGKECWGFGFNPQWGLQMYNNKAVNRNEASCNTQYGLQANKGWDTYKMEL